MNHDCNVSGNSNAISREHSKEINKSQNVYSPHWFSYISFDDSCENLVVYQDIITKLMIFLLNFPGHICNKLSAKNKKLVWWLKTWDKAHKAIEKQKKLHRQKARLQNCNRIQTLITYFTLRKITNSPSKNSSKFIPSTQQLYMFLALPTKTYTNKSNIKLYNFSILIES